jgi:plasmid stabilization system protein ParE
MKVSFNRLAEAELIAAARHLEAERHLGAAFLDEYAAWETRIRDFPESCPEIAPGIRCGYLPRFKYHITYSVRERTLRILYVRSARRQPQSHWPRQ